MILDLAYIRKDLYISNQVKSKPMYLPSGLSTTSLYIRDLYYLINTLTNKADVCTKKKF